MKYFKKVDYVQQFKAKKSIKQTSSNLIICRQINNKLKGFNVIKDYSKPTML